MDEAVRKAARIRGPMAGETFALSASTTAASANLGAYAGRWVTVVSDGNDMWFLTASSNAVASALDVTATSGNTVCQFLPSAAQFNYEITTATQWVAVKTTSGTGKFRYHISSDRTP